MISFPTHNTELLLPGPAGNLQAMLEFPAVAGTQTPVAVICHPHPPDGGSMTNKVVSTLARAFVDCGYIALRFNFRGVGQSEGAYGSGSGELQDCLAAIAWLKKVRSHTDIALAGFSFGSWVALKAAERELPLLMISIAPPVGFRDFSDVRPPDCPWLAIQGEADEIVDAERVRRWLNAQTPIPEIIMMPDTSHFFHGKLLPLREHVKAFLQANPSTL